MNRSIKIVGLRAPVIGMFVLSGVILGLAPEGRACQENSECDPADYCAKAPGDCSGTGECEPRPQVCLPLPDPVCGCDGLRYLNECYAAMVGVNVDYTGVCDCNNNVIADECDVDCGEPEEWCDVPGCGQSEDCDENGVPD
ncbi:MAG: hypothetical protein WBE26_15565, partial [Phycisphaerae bacterium]